MIVVAVAVLFVALFAAAAALLVLGFIDFYKAESALNTSKGQLEFLYGRNPFPADHNLQTERASLETLNKELAGLCAAMSRGQPEAVEQSPAKFVSQFWETRKSLLARAGEAGTKVPETFDFGFGRHMQGELPAAKDVSRLTQQLRIVETLCGILYGARVSELQGLGREEFEEDAVSGGNTASVPAPTRGRGRAAVASTPTALNSVNPQAGQVPEGQLFGKWHFVIHFSAKESGALQVLNGLAKTPLFTVVTRMQLVGDNNVAVRNSEAAVKDAEATGELATGKPAKAAAVAARDLRIVSGRDVPVAVVLEVDVYQFAKPAALSGAVEGAK